MKPVKSIHNARWLKNALWIVGIVISVVLATVFFGYIAVTFFPSVNLQHWFQQTKFVWILVRLGIYCIVGGLVYTIHRHQPVSGKAIGLLVFGISLFEILNILYIIG
ncbi:hypothetical protein [Caviibacterium pharyngocola]|uniref:Hemophilus-specific protein n=1 Tax=Caviibacterium pharyngocola TaxID=28159 RepID=A0A2M8RV81_9PAST|nr:hypothetical protein [Caviibacterium pharyngocola]PJG82785.1 hypothetical protein CVP04_07425 [Caviibacterium pharyngocola]